MDVTVNNVYKYYAYNQGVFNLNFNINRGEVIKIKCNYKERETILNLIYGIEKPTNGEISYSENIKLKIAFPSGYDKNLKVIEILKFYANMSNNNVQFDKIVENFGLNGVIDIKKSKLDKFENLLLGISVAYIQKANIIVINEPEYAKGFNENKVLNRIIKLLINENIGVLILYTSNLEIADKCDKSYYLSEDGMQEIGNINKEKVIYNLEKIPVKKEDKILLFNPSEIDFIEALNNKTSININGEVYICNFTMNYLEERLHKFGFFRSHRSFLINLQKIKEIIVWSKNSYSLILENKTYNEIPISKAKLDQLKKLIDF